MFNAYFSTLSNLERHKLSWFNEQLNTQYNNNPEEFVNILRDLYYRECVVLEDAISPQQSDDSIRSESVEMDTTDSEGNASDTNNDTEGPASEVNASKGNASEYELNNIPSPERKYKLLSEFASSLQIDVVEFTFKLEMFHAMVSILQKLVTKDVF